MSQPGSDLEVYGEPEEPTLAERQAEVADGIADAAADLARLAQEAAALAQSEPEQGTALVPTSGTAKMAKARLATMRAGAAKQAQAIERKQEEIRARQEQMKDLMREQMALAQEVMAPLEKFVARLEEGIWMVNLYLGRDEQIVLLRDGEPAAADERIVIRQMVLAMDEESAIHPEEDGIDATNIEAFDEWLKEDPAHVDQVLPNVKGVVALRPRFVGKHYEDPWKQKSVDEANQQTYFLIRNGDKLWRTWTEFNVGARLVPSAGEFTDCFYEVKRDFFFDRSKPAHRIPIQPGTLAWERAEETADARKRHYMRVALILQGLVDRTTVFHPLPEGGVSFTDFEHNGKTWTFLLDAEMALTTGRQPFRAWLNERKGQLEVGMRVVGSFKRGWRRSEDEWEWRVHPHGAEIPPSGVLLTLEERQGDDFIVRYPRTEKLYDKNLWVESEDRPGWGHRGGYKTPTRRASARLVLGEVDVIPFDLVTEEEMLVYLQARGDRHEYATMFPLLKGAIRMKRAESVEEAPFRSMLAGVLARENGVEVADAEADLDTLIAWWKLTNKTHRPLVGDEESQAKAVRMLVAEHARRLKARRKGVSDEVVRKLMQDPCHEDALLIGRRRDGRYVVVCPHYHEAIGDPERNGETKFVRFLNFTARGALKETSEWKLLRKAQIERLTVAWQSERLDSWDLTATFVDLVTGPEYDAMLREATAAPDDGVAGIAYRAEKRCFYVWRLEADAVVDEDRPISGEQENVKRQVKKRQIIRNAGPSVRLADEEYANPHYGRRGGKPWDEDGFAVVYENEEVMDRWTEGSARYDAVIARRHEMETQVRLLIESVKDAWVRRKEALEYQRFIEDFLDSELWEGHRKTLPRETFEYPYKHDQSRGDWHHRHDALRALCEYTVEAGIDLYGMTVWDAATAYFPPLAWFGEPHEWNVIGGGEGGGSRVERERFPEPIDVPEDLRSLTFERPKSDGE